MRERIAESHRRQNGFTLVELLVVIGIIILLIGILVPVVSKVRQAGMNAAAQSFMQQISRAIDAYETDFRQYPGPVTNNEVCLSGVVSGINPNFVAITTPPDIVSTEYQTAPTTFKDRITMSENLVLGLLGGLKWDTSGSPGLYYDPRLLGNGPRSLNTSGTTKQYKPYIEATNLSWRLTDGPQPEESPAGKKTGHFRDEADLVGPQDTIIPEFVDTYPEPLPILYLRAKRGAQAKPGAISEINNTIVTYDITDHGNRVGQYDLHQIIAYTNSKIGAGRSQITREGWMSPNFVHGLTADSTDKVQPFATLNNPPAQPLLKYMYPFNAYPYFRNHALSSPKESDPDMVDLGSPRNDIPHQKDGYILIGAGPDRIYGTKDDMTNFGSVGQ